MAQATVELGPAQVNGVSPLSRPGSPQSMHSSTKRKRDDDDDDDDGDVSDDASHDDAMDDDSDSKGTPLQNGDVPTRNEKALIRNFFEVLQRFVACPPAFPVCPAMRPVKTDAFQLFRRLTSSFGFVSTVSMPNLPS
jgi:hypothetical protein